MSNKKDNNALYKKSKLTFKLAKRLSKAIEMSYLEGTEHCYQKGVEISPEIREARSFFYFIAKDVIDFLIKHKKLLK